MFHVEIELRREIWDCASYVRFFTDNTDENMRKYYLGKLSGIRTMFQYVDHKTLSDEDFTYLSELIMSTLLA